MKPMTMRYALILIGAESIREFAPDATAKDHLHPALILDRF